MNPAALGEDAMSYKTEAIWKKFSLQLKNFILIRVSDKRCRMEFDSHVTIVDYQCSEYFLS